MKLLSCKKMEIILTGTSYYFNWNIPTNLFSISHILRKANITLSSLAHPLNWVGILPPEIQLIISKSYNNGDLTLLDHFVLDQFVLEVANFRVNHLGQMLSSWKTSVSSSQSPTKPSRFYDHTIARAKAFQDFTLESSCGPIVPLYFSLLE